MRRTIGQLRVVIGEFVGTNTYASAATDQLSKRARAVFYLTRLGIRILKQWARDKCPQQAAALAFNTALSLVPVTAIAFTILRSLGSLDAQSRLSDFVANQMFPGMEDIADRIEGFSKNISVGALGGVGLIFTIVTCYSLYSYVERIFNDIWRVGQRRTMVGKFLTFYAMVTLLPAMASVSLYWSGVFIGGSTAARFLAPLGIQVLGLVLMNKLLPRTNVNWRAALVGALFTAVVLEAGKFGFVRFAKTMLLESYNGVYGSLGLIPLLLIWIYASWLMVLLGAEIAFAVQNLRVLEAEDRRSRGDEPINGLLAAQLLAVVAAAHETFGKGVPKAQLVTDFGLTADVIERIVERLKKRGLIADVQGDINGYIPGRAANTITLDDVLGAFRSSDIELAEGTASDALRSLVSDLDVARKKRTHGLTIADVLPLAAAPPPSTKPL
ncbi:MAG: YihY family inner membrane protein [Deltaproteobacteria bacterium]|nr:YihY family inner membrane protein [Deltaproteobacteria bacterium]